MTGFDARRAAPDFPYASGEPVAFSARQWALLMLSVLAGFLLLVLVPAKGLQAQLAIRLLFVGIPLCTLMWFAGRQVRALFGLLTPRDVWIAALAAVLAVLLSMAAALAVQRFAPVAPNALVVSVAGMSVPSLVVNLLSTAPQLLGEELLTVLPFLAVLWLTASRWGMGRNASIAVALLVSTLIFSAAHLPTYGWNWAQCFGVIGASRLVLSLAYVVTRKLWVSTIAHILTDWTEFTLAFLVAHPR